jgi:stage IV sporulation protein FB
VNAPRGIRLGRIAGTTIEIQTGFLLLVGLFVILSLDQKEGLPSALLWVPILLVSVLFHELAHAAAIGALGFGPSQIWLTGMGGVTVNERKARPWQDMVISIAGPLASFLLALVCYLAWHRLPVTQRDPMLAALFPRMVQANVGWGIFNVLPIYPMDGGKTARHLLRIFLSERLAFVLSVWSSIALGLGIAIGALISGWFFVAIIVAMMVGQNWRQWQLYRSFKGEE